jgi:hypothetical protein
MKMKKIAFLHAMLLTLISSTFAQNSAELSGSATYGYESKFIFRGFMISDDTFTPSAEGRINYDNSIIYAGVRTALPTKKTDNKTKMHEYYLGCELDVLENFVVDLSFSHYQFLPYTDESPNEAILGLTWDVPFSPSIYVYYDLDGEMATVEGSFGYSIPLDQKTAIMLTGYVGTSDYYLGSNYAGAMVDLSYSFTRYARFTMGARFVSLSPDEAGPDMLEDDTEVWWGMSFTAGF